MASEIIGEKRSGKASLKQDGQNGLSFTSSVEFLVVTDSKGTTREEVLLGTPGLPVVGLNYGPLNATCTGKDATRREANPLYWDVMCTLETGKESQRQDPNNPSEDPTTWIPVFIVDSFLTKQKVLSVDKTPASAGNINFGVPGPYPPRNSAKQAFEEPLVQSYTLCQFSFVQFEDASLDINDILDRNECVNETTFAGRAARTLLLNVRRAELGYYGGFPAWRIEYMVTYDRDTHDVKRLDVGTCYLDSGNQKPFMDSANQYRIIGNLNGTGGKATGDPATLTFRCHEPIEFADFIRQ
jgi:hypothetical protein